MNETAVRDSPSTSPYVRPPSSVVVVERAAPHATSRAIETARAMSSNANANEAVKQFVKYFYRHIKAKNGTRMTME